MKTSLVRIVEIVLLLGLLLAASVVPMAQASSPTEAEPLSGPSQDGGHVPVRGPRAPDRELLMAYWTPERMASAFPHPGVERQGGPQPMDLGRSTLANGTARAVSGNLPGKTPSSAADFTVPNYGTGAPALTYPYAFDAVTPPRPIMKVFPWAANGKLFFTQNGTDFECSGTSVTSGVGGNENLVLTAAHCLNSGGDGVTPGSWSTNLLFVPAYRNGVGPWGGWTYLDTWIWADWLDSADDTYDYGFLSVVNSAYGSLSDKVGAQGIAWNQPDHYMYWAFGYPTAAAPYAGDGRSWACQAPTALRDPPLPGQNGEATLGIGCDFTGGSSGGGWFISFKQNNPGYANSVTTYKYNDEPLAMYGPYFDGDVETLWNLARVDVP